MCQWHCQFTIQIQIFLILSLWLSIQINNKIKIIKILLLPYLLLCIFLYLQDGLTGFHGLQVLGIISWISALFLTYVMTLNWATLLIQVAFLHILPLSQCCQLRWNLLPGIFGGRMMELLGIFSCHDFLHQLSHSFLLHILCLVHWWVRTGSTHVDSAFRIFPHLHEYSWTFAPQTSPAILFDFTNLRRSSIY